MFRQLLFLRNHLKWSWYTRWTSEHTGSVLSLSSLEFRGKYLVGKRIRSPGSEMIKLRAPAKISELQNSKSVVSTHKLQIVSLPIKWQINYNKRYLISTDMFLFSAVVIIENHHRSRSCQYISLTLTFSWFCRTWNSSTLSHWCIFWHKNGYYTRLSKRRICFHMYYYTIRMDAWPLLAWGE